MAVTPLSHVSINHISDDTTQDTVGPANISFLDRLRLEVRTNKLPDSFLMLNMTAKCEC